MVRERKSRLWRMGPAFLTWSGGTVVLAWIIWRGVSGGLGPDPAKEMVSLLGWWGFVFLLGCLAVRPLVTISGMAWLFPLRRQLGLMAFAWLTLHFLAWAWLLLGLDLAFFGSELAERPYILVGFTGWLLMLPLAVTSSRWARRRLGRKWQVLHRLVYACAVLGLAHDVWIQKSGYGEQLVFALVLGLLFGWRIWHRQKRLSKGLKSQK